MKTIQPNKVIPWISILWFAGLLTAASAADENTARLEAILSQGIEANFAGDYDRARDLFAQINAIDPRHPSQEFYQAVVLFWRNAVDPSDPRDDQMITLLLNTAVIKAEKWLEKDESNVEALHYLGLAHTYLGRLEAHRGRLYQGGVRGETGRKYLHKAMLICKQSEAHSDGSTVAACEDIYFPYGAYLYFAGRLPRLVRMLDFLWFIPQGNSEEGLNALTRSRKNSRLHHLGATSLLSSIFTLFEEDRLGQALELSSELIARFPDNPYLDLEHAKILLRAGGTEAAANRARRILSKVESKTRQYDAVVQLDAKLILAEADIHSGRLNQAREALAELESNNHYRNGLTPRIALLLGKTADLNGDRERALMFYNKVSTCTGSGCNRGAVREARSLMEKPFSMH